MGREVKLNLISKRALRDGNKVIEEMLPEDILEDYHKRSNGRIAKSRDMAKVAGLDNEINPHKWYPMFFDKDNTPTVLPQGWFYQSIGLEWWRYKLGVENLTRNIFLILGSEVLEKNYPLKKYLVYKGKRLQIRSKMIFPPEVILTHSRKSFKKSFKKTIGSDGSTKETEKEFFLALFRMIPQKWQPQFNENAIISQKLKQNKNKRNGIK